MPLDEIMQAANAQPSNQPEIPTPGPPQNEQEREERINGWEAVLQKMGVMVQSPETRAFLFRLGADLLRSRQPGQSEGDVVANALVAAQAEGAATNERLFNQQATTQRIEQEGQRTDIARERNVIAREELGQQRDLARDKLALEEQLAAQREAGEERRFSASEQAADRRFLAQMRRLEIGLEQDTLQHDERMAYLRRQTALMESKAKTINPDIEPSTINAIIKVNTDPTTGKLDTENALRDIRKTRAEIREETYRPDPAEIDAAVGAAVEARGQYPDDVLERRLRTRLGPEAAMRFRARIAEGKTEEEGRKKAFGFGRPDLPFEEAVAREVASPTLSPIERVLEALQPTEEEKRRWEMAEEFRRKWESGRFEVEGKSKDELRTALKEINRLGPFLEGSRKDAAVRLAARIQQELRK